MKLVYKSEKKTITLLWHLIKCECAHSNNKHNYGVFGYICRLVYISLRIWLELRFFIQINIINCKIQLVGDLNCIVVSRILYPPAFAVSVSHQRENDKQVKRLADIWHRNLVTLIGYCQEGGLQMVVSEYLPNGSVCGHLYGNIYFA